MVHVSSNAAQRNAQHVDRSGIGSSPSVDAAYGLVASCFQYWPVASCGCCLYEEGRWGGAQYIHQSADLGMIHLQVSVCAWMAMPNCTPPAACTAQAQHAGTAVAKTRISHMHTLVQMMCCRYAPPLAALSQADLPPLSLQMGAEDTAATASRLGSERTANLVQGFGADLTSDIVQGFGPDLTAKIVEGLGPDTVQVRDAWGEGAGMLPVHDAAAEHSPFAAPHSRVGS
jgi:hypothetical protein